MPKWLPQPPTGAAAPIKGSLGDGDIRPLPLCKVAGPTMGSSLLFFQGRLESLQTAWPNSENRIQP